jgi:hypothetical protein
MYKFIFLFVLFTHCTNYSVSKNRIVAPILVSITKVTNGHNIKVRVTNQEPFLAGYKLYTSTSESSVRNPADLTAGTDCSSALTILPNQPLEYSFDVTATPGTISPSGINRLCTFNINLTSGQFIAVRGLLVSIQPSNQTGNRVNPSLPSNSLVVP